ncbi:hypothetical protein IRZ59_04805 [Pseudomonas guariconensis]|uniref:hypothetical protein n=1 Tax=Pseudomonas guariconensis TaxID=1288410 RepID=UPI0018AB7851|nr:hypothetical protein [Pseudomonas guariconensis]MBF8729756.1 hypothetical protein [Pseudomonas guariconensis]
MSQGFAFWFAWWMFLCGLGLHLWIFGRAIGSVIYAAIVAGSFVRFAWACGKEHGFRPMPCPRWMYAPVMWGEMFITVLGAPKGSVRHMGGAGVWSGIGNWTVYPKQEAEPCA